MWIYKDGKKLFKGNHTDYAIVGELAQKCLNFCPDDEDEQVDDQELSCFNCIFRRWSEKSFYCLSEK